MLVICASISDGGKVCNWLVCRPSAFVGQSLLADQPQTCDGIRMSIDETIVQTPDGPMTWAEWKKKNPVQIPSRRTKGKKLPVKVKRFTSDP